MERLKIEYVSIDSLKEYKNNAKIHTSEQIEQIKKSIQEFGMNDPIAIWKENEIIEGHGRLIACRELGIEDVPVIRLDSLTDEQRKAYMNIHNQLTMNTGFNFEILTKELDSIESIDMSQFGFDVDKDWFELRERYEGKQEGNEEYNEFLEKFEIKKTTDDCFTPDEIYDVVASYVENKYKLNRKNFVRPFYPNGDYQSEKYKETDVVVDNPPFSILAEIQRFYTEKGIKYFLFCPALVGMSKTQVECATIIVTTARVTYENGAEVSTNFTTNLEDKYIARTDGALRKEIEETDSRIRNERRVELPKYEYPVDVLTLAMMGTYAKYDVEMGIEKNQAIRITKLDAQEKDGNAIFGGGLLLGEKARIEHEKARIEAERNKPRIVYQLSEREKSLCKSIGAQNG